MTQIQTFVIVVQLLLLLQQQQQSLSLFVNSTSLPLISFTTGSGTGKNNNNDNNSIIVQQQQQRQQQTNSKSSRRRNVLSLWNRNTNNAVLLVSSNNVVVATATATATTSSSTSNNNPITNLLSYMKDSITSTISGTTSLYKNHLRCNAIRKQQNDYKNYIIDQWIQDYYNTNTNNINNDKNLYTNTNTDKSNDNTVNKKLKIEYTKQYNALKNYNNGGNITYDDYIFLQNGKVDRGKVFNLIFLMWGAPKFLPYALLFNKDLLPSTFNKPKSQNNNNNNNNINIRSCIVLRTLMELELENMKNNIQQQQQTTGTSFNLLSLFINKDKVIEQQKLINTVYQSTQNLLLSSSLSSNNNNNNNNNRNKSSNNNNNNNNNKQTTIIQPSSIMATMAPYIYRVSNPLVASRTDDSTSSTVKADESTIIPIPPLQVLDFTKSEKALCTVPKCVVKGLVDAIACSGVGNGGGATATATTGSSIFNGGGILSLVQPYFLKRQNLVKHIQKIISSDEFLIYNNINLNTISTNVLIDTCNDRLIYPPSIIGLQQWLHYTVQQPLLIQQRLNNNNSNSNRNNNNPSTTIIPPSSNMDTDSTQNNRELFYNSAVARVALMSYYACQSIRNNVLHPPSSSSPSSSNNSNNTIEQQQQQQQQQPCVVLPRLLLSSTTSAASKPITLPVSPAL